MAFEYKPPKYAQVIAELQRRIESGEYPPGSLLPSEHQLSAEFGVGPADSGPGTARAAAGRLDRHSAGQGQLRARPPGTSRGRRRAARPRRARPG